MKKILFIIILIIPTISIFGQIGGISASKLATLCAATVPEKAIEFEPVFGFSYAQKAWDKDNNSYPLFQTNDSTQTSSGFGFRFSYGAVKNLEIGIALPVDVSGISFGVKYKLPFESKYSVGILAGLNTPVGNQVIDKKNKTLENTAATVGGLVMTYEFGDKLSIDFDAQYQVFVKKVIENHKNDIFINSDIGYYITDGFQLVVGMNYSNTSFDDTDFNSSLLILNPGVTIERAENFLIVLNAPVSLTGKNIEQSIGFGFALTISIN